MEIASATAMVVSNTTMLFMIFTTCPVPTSPQCVISLPMVSRIGFTRANTSGDPPTMIESVPSTAARRVRAIGVSNFKAAHIDRLLAATGVAPDVNQVELNPTTTRDAIRAYDAEHGIVTQAWAPLGQGGALLSEPTIVAIARRHGRTPAQVVLRWHIELGHTAVPKSADPTRMAANLAVFDFELAPEDVAAISALDRGESAATDSDALGH